MNSQTEILEKSGIKIPKILLPKANDLKSWAVIACDQYTQDKAYWEDVAQIAGEDASTLKLIFPEVFLDEANSEERIAKIKATMKEYLAKDSCVFKDGFNGAVYLERKTEYGRTRNGLILAIDLEAYDWNPLSKVAIRATEATIVERIPPRMKIRRNAPLELPHIMLLANDPEHLLVKKIGEKVKSKTPLYDSDLMKNAGHVTGWACDTDEEIQILTDAICRLSEAGTDADGNVFLFAVGDGNHSLATAKAVWDEFKKENATTMTEDELAKHPARYALIEIVNLYDGGLTFEPIHRVLFNVKPDFLAEFLKEKLGGTIIACSAFEELEALVADKTTTRFGFVCEDAFLVLESPSDKLAVSRLQPELDTFLKENLDAKIDYIHGTEEVLRLGVKNDTGVLLPPIDKDSFFSTIATGGPLPRKSFSMGESSEKRFYLECRKLF